MELDDLRRQWQQPDPAALPPVSPAHLEGLLLRNSGSLVEKMRRNTWSEALLTLLIVVGIPFYTWNTWGQALHTTMAGVMLLLSAILLVNYYRQLVLLRRMAQAEAQVRTHLGTLCAGLRQLLHFYYRLTMASGPLTLLLLLGFLVGKELARPGDFRWPLIAGLAAAFVGLGAVVQVGVGRLTRWYLQRLYGQHLDRLEASLRELDDAE